LGSDNNSFYGTEGVVTRRVKKNNPRKMESYTIGTRYAGKKKENKG
jgi:hypothetical protein